MCSIAGQRDVAISISRALSPLTPAKQSGCLTPKVVQSVSCQMRPIQRQNLGLDGSVQAVRPLLTKGSPASTDCLKLSQVPVTAARTSIPNAFLPVTRDPARYLDPICRGRDLWVAFAVKRAPGNAFRRSSVRG